MENLNEENNNLEHNTKRNNNNQINKKKIKNQSVQAKNNIHKETEVIHPDRSVKVDKVSSAMPAEFESVPSSKSQISKPAIEYRPKKSVSFDSNQTIPLTWRSFFEEIRYEQNLLTKDIKELSSSAKFVSKNILKKFTSLATTKIRQKAEYYPDSIRKLADSLCSLEKEVLKDIKDPRKQEQEEQIFGPK